MTSDKDNQSRFTIHDAQEDPEALYMADADNLRIEKLSTRVTLVAVLIPCLLVIVLAIAYLDIKNRVIKTQNTGSMGVQNLSKDLESRFSNLSLKQAKLDELLSKQTKSLETAKAAWQVNLNKATNQIKKIAEGKPDHADVKAISKKTESSIQAIAGDMSKQDKEMSQLTDEIKKLRGEMKGLNTAFKKFDEDLAAQILLMAKGLKKDQGRLSKMEKKTQELETEKLGKEALNLAIGLERLALQEMVRDKIREVEKKLSSLDQQLDNLDKKWATQKRKSATPPPSAKVPSTALPPSNPPSSTSTIVEQKIN